MAIVYYPNRIYKGKVPAIDRVMAKRDPLLQTFSQNIMASSFNAVISANTSWQTDSISFSFNNVAAKDYGFGIQNGRQIVEHYNDYLWFQITATIPQIITLTPGFYSGSQLATELQTRLNAATLLDGSVNVFNTAGQTFTVAYDNVAGTFTVAPATEQIRYLNTANKPLPIVDSIAGHLFGFNVTGSFASSVISDTLVPGLNNQLQIITTTGAPDVSFYHDTTHTLNIDQAIYLYANSAAYATNVSATATIVYEEII